MPDTPLLEYQGRRAEAARYAVRQPTSESTPPARRYAEARALVREALTFPDALEAAWSQLKADAEADLVGDFEARGLWLRDFLDRFIGAMEAVLEWARGEAEALGQEIPRTGALAAAIEEAKRFRDRVLASWPDPDRDFGDAPPTLGALDVAEGTAYIGPDDFTARLHGG